MAAWVEHGRAKVMAKFRATLLYVDMLHNASELGVSLQRCCLTSVGIPNNVRRTKSQHLHAFRLVLLLYWPNSLKPGVK